MRGDNRIERGLKIVSLRSDSACWPGVLFRDQMLKFRPEIPEGLAT